MNINKTCKEGITAQAGVECLSDRRCCLSGSDCPGTFHYANGNLIFKHCGC